MKEIKVKADIFKKLKQQAGLIDGGNQLVVDIKESERMTVTVSDGQKFILGRGDIVVLKEGGI